MQGKLANKTKIEIMGKVGNFYKISYSGKTGYVSNQYVKITTK
ncbi:SH3 domain-containing protein [Clostridium estertheticum]|nr:SH3 domain-containing protein [Clostridium estertheticum]